MSRENETKCTPYVYDEEGEPHGVTFEVRDALVTGCNALLGLLQLLSHRKDLPPEVLEVLTNNHRIDEAKEALKLSQEK